jgi:hypothetical protein
MFIVVRPVSANLPESTTYGNPMLCAVSVETLDFVMEIAKDMDRLLYFVREQSFLTLEDRRRAWKNDGNPTKLQHFRSNNETKKKYKG